MASSQDTEITLGTAKLLGLFFGLVVICAVFFALGYTLGRKSDTSLSAATPVGTLTAPNGAKPATSGAASATPMTFYKAVEQQNANPQLTPAAAVATTPESVAGQPSASQSAGSSADGSASTALATQGAPTNPPDPSIRRRDSPCCRADRGSANNAHREASNPPRSGERI